jgi:hypothetical protein
MSFARATKFCTLAHNICGSSVWEMLRSTLMMPSVLRYLLYIIGKFMPPFDINRMSVNEFKACQRLCVVVRRTSTRGHLWPLPLRCISSRVSLPSIVMACFWTPHIHAFVYNKVSQFSSSDNPTNTVNWNRFSAMCTTRPTRRILLDGRTLMMFGYG